MASTKEYKNFIVEQLNELGDIKTRPMMGEYLVYYKDVYFAGVFDDRFLVKIVPDNMKYEMKEVIPYDGAKPMYLVDSVDNIRMLEEIVLDTYNGLLKSKKTK